MKYLIFSDLHGSIDSLEKIIAVFEKEKCDKMICLGDVLYHGPRNDLPPFYEPKKVVELINSYKDKMICIEGNCDAEVDRMVLDFPLSKSLDLNLNGINFHLEHGHHIEELNWNYEVVLYGHTHITAIEKKKNGLYINLGSITIPKKNTARSYAILNEKTLTIFDITHRVIEEVNF